MRLREARYRLSASIVTSPSQHVNKKKITAAQIMIMRRASNNLKNIFLISLIIPIKITIPMMIITRNIQKGISSITGTPILIGGFYYKRCN
jgi:hypothetical protein